MSVTPTELFRRNARKLFAQPVARPQTAPVKLSILPLEDRVVPAITGLVFNDLNANGVFEPNARTQPNAGSGTYVSSVPETGLAGVKVTAFRADGSVAGIATSGANGEYNLSVDPTGSYRVEFTSLPVGTGYGPQAAPGASGRVAGTAVRLLSTGTASEINLSVISRDSIGDNPLLVTSRYVYAGTEDRPFNVNRDAATIVAFPYAAGSTVGSASGYDQPGVDTQPVQIPHSQVGTTWGLGTALDRGVGYAASYTKRHSGYGPNGAGAIYAFALPGAAAGGLTTTAAPWLVLPSAAVNASGLQSARSGYASDDDWNRDSGNLGWDSVGKSSFGGLDVNDANTEVYVMNLGDQSLYVVPINPDGSSGTPRAFAVPTPLGRNGQPIARGDVRPFAVEYHNGLVYVGIVNSAESTQDRADLRAYVYSFDPVTRQFSAGSVVDDGSGADGIDLTYTRGISFGGRDEFVPWSPVFANVNGEYRLGNPPQNAVKYPQPMLVGLSFDSGGNLSLGFRTRDGDQTGFLSYSDPNFPSFAIEGVGSGDLLKAFNTGTNWVLEQNGSSPTSAVGQSQTGTGVNNNQGPGGGEFFGLDGAGTSNTIDQTGNSDNIHHNVTVGGILTPSNFPNVIATSFDPVPTGDTLRSGGARWFNNTTGELDKAYMLFTTRQTDGRLTFGKAAGLGDLVAVPSPSAEIGNRVWQDSNRNGVQDAGEPALAGVTVLATALTDSNGEYLFSSRTGVTSTDAQVYAVPGLTPNRTYTVRVPLGSGPAAGRRVSPQRADGSVSGDLRDSDFAASGEFAVASVTPTVSAPVTHNTDLGLFVPPLVALGDTVWNDVNNDGTRQIGEPLLGGVTVTLFSQSGAQLAQTTTDTNGEYLFPGLEPGTYYVEIATAGQYAGFISSTGVNGTASGPYEPGITTNVDDQDHGTQINAALVRSGLVTLFEPGSVLNPSTVTATRDANLTVDFGLFQPLSIGDFVWNDADNDGTFDAGEVGIGGVRLDLLNGSGQVLLTTSTNAAGGYLFTNLSPGQYQVRVNRASLPNGNFRSSSGAAGFAGPFEPAPGDTGDNTDHGTTAGGFVNGPVFTLDVGSAPLGESPTAGGIPDPAADANSDRTQDFGFFENRPLSIGNFVWEDRNNTGVFDAGDTPLDGFTVQLLNGTDQVIGTTVTANGGLYLFTDLFPGTYRVRVLTAGTDYRSSTGTNGNLVAGDYEPGVTGFQDNQDHGTQGNGFVQAAAITLGLPGDTASNPDTGGLANLRQDFGLFRPLTIGNFVWDDVNNSGVFDAGEAPLAGVSVSLLDPSGTVILDTQTTDANGNYLFTGLVPGAYIVRVSPPSGYRSSTGANGFALGAYEPGVSGLQDNEDHGTQVADNAIDSRVTLGLAGDTASNPDTGGLANLRQDFGLFRPLTIGNFVWDDTNNNGFYDDGEFAAGGVTVELLNGAGQLVATTVTNTGTVGQNNYLFFNLAPGTYQVRLRLADSDTRVSSTGTGQPVLRGSLNTAAFAGPTEPAAGGTENNRDKGTQVGTLVVAPAFTLGGFGDTVGNPDFAGTANLRQDFGLVTPLPPPIVVGTAEVSGYVYRDTTVINGVRQPTEGETGIPGVTVTLTGNGISRSTTTDANGFYQFVALDAGDYVITETQPPLFIDGIDTPGNLGGTTPRNDVLTVTLQSGDVGTEYNFGEILPASVFGFVYVDTNNNCVFDSGESPISGVQVTITGTAFAGSPLVQRALAASDSPVGLTVRTDASGRYEFPLLPPGVYTVTELQPLTDNAGRRVLDGCDSPQEQTPGPVTVGNDIFSGVVVGPSGRRGPLNFGELPGPNQTEPSKQEFLGSSGNGIGTDPSVTPPATIGPADLPTNPPFAVGSASTTPPRLIAVGTGVGRASQVRVFDYASRTERNRFAPYEPSFTGGVRVTTGDVDGDGVEDVITATGPGGGPRVRVFSGVTGAQIREFFAYEESFRGGVFVASADLDGDGAAEIICGAEIGGGPRVTVFDGRTNAMVQSYFAFDPAQRGGVRIAAADFTGDGRADLVVSTGAGVPTRVRVFQGNTGSQLGEFTPYSANFTGGVFVAAGDTNGDGVADVITSADAGGGPHVQVFNGLSGQAAGSFFAYETDFTGGARVTALDVTGDGKAEIITTPGLAHTPQLKILQPNGTLLETFNAFDAQSDGGIYVG